MIGKVVFSSTQEVIFRIQDDVEVETITVGTLIIINSYYKYLARISSVELKNLGENTLADKVATINTEDVFGDIQSALGEQFYYVCKARVVGIVDGRIRGAKSIPKFLSTVRKAEKEDLSFLEEMRGDVVEVGMIRDVDIPILLDRKYLITRHCGVFGKTGSGKSNTVKVILSKLIEKKTPCLVFDIHSEYSGYECLRSSKDVVIMGIGNCEDVTISLPLSAIKPKDVRLVTSINETQGEAIDMIRRRYKKEWISYISGTDSKAISKEFEDKISDMTIGVLKRKLDSLEMQCYVGTSFNSLEYMFQALCKHKTLVIEFGEYEYNDYAIRLITTVVSRFLLEKYKNAKRQGTNLPETLIVLEEAHKLLSKDLTRLTIFEEIVREGRKFNIGLLVVDQTPRKIHEEVISQLNTVIIMLLTNIKDREHLVLSSENDLSDFKDEMARLDVGEMIVTGISVPVPLFGKVPEFVGLNQKTQDSFDAFSFNE